MTWEECVCTNERVQLKSCPKKSWHRLTRSGLPGAFRCLSPEKQTEETNLQTYFTRILPFASSVPCTRTRLPSNLATSV